MKLTTAFAALFFTLTATAADPLVVYSHRHYEADEELFALFTEQTGIEVNVVKAGASELLERLKTEGDKSPADILITADAGRLGAATKAGLLAPVSSKVLEERIPASLRDPQGHWFGFTKRARVMVYHPDRVKASELSTYEDLADKKWKGRLLVRSSSNIYNQSLMGSLIEANGLEASTEWAPAVRQNMARPPQGSDRDQIRAVAAGLGDVALVNTYYVGLLLNSSDPADKKMASAIRIHFPNQNGRGTHVNVSGGGVVKASDRKADAVKLLEFLTSKEAQARFPQATYEYPVVEGIAWSKLQESWGQFTPDPLSLTKLSDQSVDAVKAFNRAGWE